MKRLFVVCAVSALAVPFAYTNASGGSPARATTSICHRTTSASRPYVKIRVSAAALRTHARHAADIVPAPRRCPRTRLTATSGGVGLPVALAGETEIPAGDPVATGSATIRLRRGQAQVCYRIDVDNLASPAAAAHIHRGAEGSVGAVVVPLGTPGATGAVRGCARASRTVVRQILAARGRFYVNVHTAEFPGGAVRGQLANTSRETLGETVSVTMNGSNERPAGDTNGSGTAVVRFRRADGQVCYRLAVADIQLPAAGAHIHRGAAGVNGPIVVQMTAPGASGVSSGCTEVSTALIDEIRTNLAGFYVNVHTREFPGGAVRAQLG